MTMKLYPLDEPEEVDEYEEVFHKIDGLERELTWN